MTKRYDEWYRPDISRKELKELTQRSDAKGLIDFAIWGVCLGASGYLAYLSLGTYWVIPAFFLYGTIYSSCDARWHECAHGTPFRTHWLNEVFYRLVSLMNMREGTYLRWSHTRHHTETIQVGIDPEIQVMRPANYWKMVVRSRPISSSSGSASRPRWSSHAPAALRSKTELSRTPIALNRHSLKIIRLSR